MLELPLTRVGFSKTMNAAWVGPHFYMPFRDCSEAVRRGLWSVPGLEPTSRICL